VASAGQDRGRALPCGPTIGVALAGLLMIGVPARAERLTLKDAFALAAQNNLHIRIAQAEELAAQAAVSVRAGRFALGLTSTAEALQRAAADQGRLGTQFRYAVGLNKLFASGTQVSATGVGSSVWGRASEITQAAGALDPPRQIDPFYFQNPGYSGVDFTVQQALLRGAGLSANEAPVKAASELLAAARIAREQELATQLRDVEVGYWRWAAAVRAVDIRRTSLKLAETQRDRTAELIRRGRQADTDALLAEQVVADRQDALAVAVNESADRREALQALMGYAYVDMPTADLTPEDFPQIAATIDPIDTLLRQARGGSYTTRRLGHERSALEEELRATEDASWPQLDAVGTLRLSGNDHTLGSSYADTLRGNTYEWLGGVRFSYPLGGNPAAAEAERMQAKLASERSSVEEAGRQVDLAVVSTRRELALGLSRITLATLARRLATEKLRAEEERYTIGRTTMQNVRQFQEDLDQAGLRELETRLGFLAARAQLDFLLGRFLATRGLGK
jgi:outer membrane protein